VHEIKTKNESKQMKARNFLESNQLRFMKA